MIRDEFFIKAGKDHYAFKIGKRVVSGLTGFIFGVIAATILLLPFLLYFARLTDIFENFVHIAQ